MQLTETKDLVNLVGDMPMTDSLRVAHCFGKRHDNVLQAIRNLDIPEKWHLLNFKECLKINKLANKKKEPYYQITRDGFALLAMGFTGKKAMRWKLAYIEAFNKMEAHIRAQELYAELYQAQRLLQIEEDKASMCGRGLVLSKHTRPPLRNRITIIHDKLQLQLDFDIA